MESVQYNIDNRDEHYGMDNTNEQYGMDNANEHYGMDNTNGHYEMDNANEPYGMHNMQAKIPTHFTDQHTFYGNPVKEERQPTDTPFITVYSIILFIWLYVIITVINYDTVPIENLNLTREIDLIATEQVHPRFTWKFPLCTIMSGLIAFGYVYFLTKSLGKYVIYIGLFLMGCLIILLIVLGFYLATYLSIVSVSGFILIIVIIALFLLVIVYLIVSFRCIRNIGVDELFEIVRDSCRVLNSCPSITIFACVMSIIIILILIFMVFMTKMIVFSDCSDGIFRFYIIVNAYCAVALMNFLSNFTQIVIAGYVMDYAWLNDPTFNSVTLISHLQRIFKYHMGTVAFLSIPLLPHIWSIYQLCRSVYDDVSMPKRYDILTRICSQLRTFMNIVDFSMIQTSIYGYNCRTAIKAAHDLVSQNNHGINLAVCQASDMVVAFGAYLIAIPFHMERLNTSVYSLAIPFYIIFATTVRTLLVNKMINNCASEELKDQHGNVPPQYGTVVMQ